MRLPERLWILALTLCSTGCQLSSLSALSTPGAVSPFPSANPSGIPQSVVPGGNLSANPNPALAPNPAAALSNPSNPPPPGLAAQPPAPLPGNLPVQDQFAAAPAPALTGLSIVTRSQWGALPAKGPRDPHSPNRITIHHAAQASSSWQGPPTMLAMQADHKTRVTNGDPWVDIGYHYVIGPDGTIYEGTDRDRVGAHAGNPELNRGNLGICLFGNFESEQVPQAQWQAAAQLIATLSKQYSIPKGTQLLGHKDQHQTSCPGANLHPKLSQLQAQAEALF